MKAEPLLLVPYHEVRHDQPDDCLHYEEVQRRGHEMHWHIPAHRHEALHQFQMLTKGSVAGSIDGKEFQANAPVMLMLAPGSVHGFTYKGVCEGHQVTVPSGTLQQLLADSDLLASRLGQSFVFAPGEEPIRVLRCFEQIADEFCGSADGRVHALLGLATLLAVEYSRRRGEQFDREQSPGVRDTLIKRYLSLVEAHYKEHRPLDFYAASLEVTPDHLSRTCRKMLGKGALQVLQDRLLLEARRLLAYTAMPVGAIAHQLGFEDSTYFTKSFGRGLGTSPKEYRTLVAHGVRSAASR